MEQVEGAKTFRTSGSAYDRFMGRYSIPLAKLFADAAAVGDAQRVLDVGCGPGALTRVLVDRLCLRHAVRSFLFAVPTASTRNVSRTGAETGLGEVTTNR